jgi:DNA-binding LacI/PurR family transcriptional regulator
MKVVSTATSFTLDRYNNTYTYPCVINDYLAGVEQSLLYYQQDGLNRFGFFASGKHGLHNYELYKQIFKRNNAEFILKYTAICPESSQTTNSVTERTKYYARTLFDQDLPHVIFSDGEANIREVISLLSESRDGQKILEKIRFCTIGTPGVSSNYFGGNVDLITPNNEKLGEVTAEKLIEFIKNGNLRENRYYVPSIFVPQKITQQGGIS